MNNRNDVLQWSGRSEESDWPLVNLDITDKGEEYMVTTDVPGFEPDEIDVK